MIRSGAETQIRHLTARVSSGAIDSTQLLLAFDSEYSLFRREVSAVAPRLYLDTSATQVLTSSDSEFNLPSDYERAWRFEMQEGSDWFPLEPSDELNPHISTLNWREEDSHIQVAPASGLGTAGKSFRLVYLRAPTMSGDYTIDLPAGLEMVPIHRVAADFVRGKTNEDPGGNLAAADRIWRAQKPILRKRYGMYPRSGLRITGRRWGYLR